METKRINEQVKRNIQRFPERYCFQLSLKEKAELVAKCDRFASLNKQFKNAHDRFLIIDGVEVYHIGASLKDLGLKWFAFSKMALSASEILKRLI